MRQGSKKHIQISHIGVISVFLELKKIKRDLSKSLAPLPVVTSAIAEVKAPPIIPV